MKIMKQSLKILISSVTSNTSDLQQTRGSPTALNVLTAHVSEYTVGFWFDNPPNILEFNPEQHRSPVYTRLTEHELGQLVFNNSHHTESDRSITVLWVLGHVPNLINIAPKLRWLRLSAFTEEVRNLSLFRTLHER